MALWWWAGARRSCHSLVRGDLLTGFPGWAGLQAVPCSWVWLSFGLHNGLGSLTVLPGWLACSPGLQRGELMVVPLAARGRVDLLAGFSCWAVSPAGTWCHLQNPFTRCSVPCPPSLLLGDLRGLISAISTVFPEARRRCLPPNAGEAGYPSWAFIFYLLEEPVRFLSAFLCHQNPSVVDPECFRGICVSSAFSLLPTHSGRCRCPGRLHTPPGLVPLASACPQSSVDSPDTLGEYLRAGVDSVTSCSWNFSLSPRCAWSFGVWPRPV